VAHPEAVAGRDLDWISQNHCDAAQYGPCVIIGGIWKSRQHGWYEDIAVD